MKTNKLFSVFVIAIVAIFMLTMVLGSVQAVSSAKVKVTWNGNGGKIGTAKTKVTTHTTGAKVKKLPTTPKRVGYVFNGWYTKKTGGTKVTVNTKIKKKVNHYAQWAKQYTLTFDPNGGNITTQSKKVGNKKAYGALPTPTRPGYVFNGWYTSKTGGTKVSSTTKMPSKNTIVYAQWKRVLNKDEQKLVGTWGSYFDGGQVYRFYADGTYIAYHHFTSFADMRQRGFWSINNGVLTCISQWSSQTDRDTYGYYEEFGYVWSPWGDVEIWTHKIGFTIDQNSFAGKQCFDFLDAHDEFQLQTDRYIKDRVGSVPW